MPLASETKPARLNIRVSEHQKHVITHAARLLDTTVSDFVLDQAYQKAQAVLADQSRFVLSEKEWKQFCKALDAPPKAIPELRKLLSEPSVFDG